MRTFRIAKNKLLLILLPLLLYSQSGDWQYLSQTPPDLKPEIFAPGIISGKGRIHCFPAISPDGREIVWMTLPPKVWSVRYENEQWSEPGIPGFAKDILCLRPCFSPDGSRIFFASNLPEGVGSLDIWYVERTDSGFTHPNNPGPPVNSDRFEAQQTFTETGTVYYNGTVEGKRWNRGILRSGYENGSYRTPEILPGPVNIFDSTAVDYTPFIANDESYLLFCSNRHNMEEENCRIYISFRSDDDRWSDPVNISDRIGFQADSRDPYVSPDRKFLFFSSGENIYWISSRILEMIKSETGS